MNYARSLAVLVCFLSVEISSVSVIFQNNTRYEFNINYDVDGPKSAVTKPWDFTQVWLPKQKKGQSNGYEQTVMSKDFPGAHLVLSQQLYKKRIGGKLISKLGFAQAQGSVPKVNSWSDDNKKTWGTITNFTLKDAQGKIHNFVLRYGEKDFQGQEWTLVYSLAEKHVPPKRGKRYQISSTKGNPNKINIFSWNLYLMTFEGAGLSRVLANLIAIGAPQIMGLEKPGVAVRARLIPDAIDQNNDVVLFNEAWDKNARKDLLLGMKKRGFLYATCILGSGYEWKGNGDNYRKEGVALKQRWIIDFNDPRFGTNDKYTIGDVGTKLTGENFFAQRAISNGGVIIVSKYPIVDSREHIFVNNNHGDKQAKKGLVYAKVNKEGKMYHILATHLPTGKYGEPAGKDRLGSYKEIVGFIQSLNIPKTEPVIIGGDLNVGMGEPEEAVMLRALNATLPQRRGAGCDKKNLLQIFGGEQLEKLGGGEKPRCLDYILYFNNYQKPKQSFFEMQQPLSKKPWSLGGFKLHGLANHDAIFSAMTF